MNEWMSELNVKRVIAMYYKEDLGSVIDVRWTNDVLGSELQILHEWLGQLCVWMRMKMK